MNPQPPATFPSGETWLYPPAFRQYLFLLFGLSAGASRDRMVFSSVKRWSLAQRVASAAQTRNLVIETEVFDIGPRGQRRLERCDGLV